MSSKEKPLLPQTLGVSMFSKEGLYIPEVWEFFHREGDPSHPMRVKGYIKGRKRELLETGDDVNQIINQMIMEEPGYDPDQIFYYHCARHEAEFITGYGVSGAIVALEDVVMLPRDYFPPPAILASDLAAVERIMGLKVDGFYPEKKRPKRTI